MTRQLEQFGEERQAKRNKAIARAVEFGLLDGVSRAGGELTGLAIKYSYGECLVVVKAVFPSGPQVAFVGSEDLGGCLIKAAREASRDKLSWRADKYVGKSEGGG